MLFKPLDYDPNKKYPTMLYVYGGPGVQVRLNIFCCYTNRSLDNVKIRKVTSQVRQHRLLKLFTGITRVS